MKKLLSCAFNIDTANVELKYSDGSQINISCQDVEDSIETTIRTRAELDWLIYNAPLEYASMVLNGTLEDYLRKSSGNQSMENYN